MALPSDLPQAFYRALARTPEQREASLRSSPYFDLNQKYKSRMYQRLANRMVANLRQKLELVTKRLAEVRASNTAMRAKINASAESTAKANADIKKTEHEKLMKKLKADAAFTKAMREIKEGKHKKEAVKPAPSPKSTSSAADVLQEMINKRYRLK